MRLRGIQAILDTKMTFSEVCEMLDKSPRSVRYYIKNYGLPCLTVGRTLYFDGEAVIEWCKRRKTGDSGRFQKLKLGGE